MSPIAPNQSGIALVAVLVFLLVIAAAVALRGGEELADVKLAAADAEARRVDYVAQAGMQRALWTVKENACSGGVTIPTTSLDGDSYSATITGGGSTNAYTLSVDQDAWIRSDNPTNTGGGDQHVRSEGGNFERPLYRFDLSALPSAAQINSAVAWFYLESGKEHPEGPVTVNRITADWTEAGATWAALGAEIEAATLAMIPAQPVGGVWVSVNLTGQVQAWINGQPNYGIALSSTAEGIHSEYKSREDASYPPRLEVVVGNGTPSPLNIQATGTLAGGKQLTLSRPAAPAYQPPGSYTFQPDPAEGIDAYIWEANKSTNYGNDDEVWVSEATNSASRSLFRFNMGAIPAGARIVNATLSLQRESGNNPNVPVTAHRINQSWDEAAVTWNWADNDNNWNTQGGDLDATVFDTVLVGPANDRYEWDITVLAQGWVDGAYPNYGVALATAQDGSIGERFFSSDETLSDRRPILTLTYACECGTACLTPQGNGNLLMVVINPTTLVPTDAYKKALFESWGYTVTLLSESANQSAYDAATATVDAVFISETVNSSQVGTKLQNAPIGVVSQDGAYNSDLGLAGGSAWPVGSAVNVADTDHYITRPFAAGLLEMYSAAMEQLAVSGAEAPELQTLADAGGAGALVVLDAGATGTGGTPTPGRRVVLPLGRDGNTNWDYFSNDGHLLVQRAIAWAMGADAAPPGLNVLLVVANAASPSSRSAGRRDLIESWGHTVTLIDDGDSQANFNTAMAANDVVYVTDTVSGPTLLDKVTNTTTPVVNEKGSKLGNFGFSSTESGTVNAASFTSTDAAHYITEPYSGNPVTVFTSSMSMGVPSGTLAPDLQNVGEVSGTPALATLEAGATLWNGGSAPARRAHVPLGAAEVTQITDEGKTIIRRAIEWGAGAGGLSGTFLDEFNAIAYDGNDGTLDWSNDWQESGESDGPGGGDFSVINNSWCAATSCLQIREDRASSRSLAREANLDGAASATLSLSYRRRFVGAPTGGAITLEISDNGGASFTPLKVYQMDTEDTAQRSDSFDISAYIAADTQIRFSTSNDLFETALYVDDVLIDTTGGGAASYAILLVSGDAAAPPAKDTGMETLMTGWGFTVDWIDDGDSQANFDTKMAAADIVYISGTASGPSLLDKVTGVDKGVVNEINGKLDNFGFSSSTSLATIASEFSKTDPLHYITEPFAGDPATISSSILAMPVPSGTLAPDLQQAGQANGVPALVTLDAGATRWDGNPAPARRAHLPFTNADSSELTADGETIMERTIRWAAGEGSGEGSGGGGGGGPTGVVFEEFTEAKGTAVTDLSIAKPAGTTAGDLLISTLVTDGSRSGSMSPPAGWTMIDLAEQGGNVTFGVWWKLAGASEPASYTWSWGGGEKVYGTIMRFTGHDPADPIDVTTTAGGSSSAPPSPAVTTTVADAMILRLGGFDDDDITVDAPGLAGHTAITMDKSSQGNGTSSSGAGYVMQAAVGGSGTSAFALTRTEEYRTVTLAIAPAP